MSCLAIQLIDVEKAADPCPVEHPPVLNAEFASACVGLVCLLVGDLYSEVIPGVKEQPLYGLRRDAEFVRQFSQL